MSSGFVKLYGTILDSSIWGEPLAVRIVWITMLALADKDGLVVASSDGISRRARVGLKATDSALETLSAPDPRSKSPDYEGRRIERVDGGWRILNYEKYRELRTEKQIADAERIRQKREQGEYDSRGPCRHDATRSNVAPEADAEAEAKADTDSTTTARESLESIAAMFPKPTAALAMLRGMTQGLGSPGGKAIADSVLHEAALELSVAGGDFTAHRFKTFVNKVLERQSTHPRPAPPSRNPAPKKAAWLVAKEQADSDEYLNRQPEVKRVVEQAKNADPAWWKQMQTEAKAADRWAMPYAYERLTANE